MRKLIAVVACAALLAGCGKSEETPSGGGGGAGQPAGRKTHLSSPEGVLKTFVEVAEAKDAKTAGSCFSKDCEKESAGIRAEGAEDRK